MGLIWPWTAVLASAGCVLQAAFIVQDCEKHFVCAAILKTVAALLFVLVGALGLLASGNATAATAATAAATAAPATPAAGAGFVVAGLALGAVGDALHALRFTPRFKARSAQFFSVGTGAFLLGHVAYLAYLIPRNSHLVISFVLSLCLVGLLIYLLSQRVCLRGAHTVLGVAYLFVLSSMFICEVVDFILGASVSRILFAAGSLLFVISDTLLAINTFGQSFSAVRRIKSLATYYAAQMLIALSIVVLA